MMRKQKRIDPVMVEEAAAWSLRISDSDLNAEEELELSKWLKASPRHIEELLLTSALLSSADDLDAWQDISVEDLIARADTSVVPIGTKARGGQPSNENQQPARARKWVIGLGTAAAILIAVMTGWLTLAPEDALLPQSYTTEVGEQRSFTLADGSVIHINTRSELVVQYDDDARVIDLITGEALFQVAKDSERPFRVVAGDTVIEAIGTEFNVYRAPYGTKVTVIEGRVSVLSDDPPGGAVLPGASEFDGDQVNSILLNAGEEALANGGVVTMATADIARTTSWRRRVLVFRGDPLSAVAEEFNRYNRLQIIIDDPLLAAMPLKAVLNADNPQSLLDLLEGSRDIEVERRGDTEIIVRLKPSDAG
ncbi:MAG: FecR domain-containing protein [Sphingomonadales bacterium]